MGLFDFYLTAYLTGALQYRPTDDELKIIFSKIIEYKKMGGNVKEKSFEEIFKNNLYKKFCKENERCNRCDVSCVIETSFAYSINPL